MGNINLSDYKKIYLETAREYVDKLSKSLQNLENNPSDRDSLNDLYISAHSLRSQSQVMSYNSMSVLAGEIEKIARASLEGKYIINTKIIPILKEAAMEVSLLLSDIEKNNKEKDVSFIVKRLEEFVKG